MAHHLNTTSSGSESNESKPKKLEDLIPPTVNSTTTWDFAPFLSVPAVKAKSGSNEKVNLLNIPRSKITSPLANNLSPGQVMEVKEYLVGKDGSSKYGGNGKEIWLSWKRAWDIWNNYYIEGRSNAVWIRKEWEEREARKKEWDAGRDDRRRVREKKRADATGGYPPLNLDHDPLLPEDKLPKEKHPVERGHSIPPDLGSVSIVSGWTPGDSFIEKKPVEPLDPNTPPYAAKDDEIWEKIESRSEKGRRVKMTWILHKRSESIPASPKNPNVTTIKSVDEEDESTENTGSRPKNAPPVNATSTDSHDALEDEEMQDFEDDCVLETIIDDAESDSDSEPPPKEPNVDGSSGGYKPLKMLEEYYEPDEDEDDGRVWVDSVANTLWSPRRVREKTLKIELDGDIEDLCKKTEFTVDGGVDCSRSPFPVLRPVIEYVRTETGAFRKKKAWDGVTGTIFNLPTQPLESCLQSVDDRTQRIKDMYSDPIRDNPFGKDSKLFPLDIRRVLKVIPMVDPPWNICDESEERVRDLALYPEKKYREMNPDDSWYVTDTQKMARDAPPRRHPPRQPEFSGKYLPLDDQHWREEQLRDLNHNAGYFVTNLHGGTLIINGMEIKKGDVAGPLPEFAIIECPAGQVTFWWGVSGRHYGKKSQNENRDHSAKWEILRKQDASWKDVAKPTGEVWDAIIRDRKEREKTGENEDDDEQWVVWKRAQKAKSSRSADDRNEEPRQPGRFGPIPRFSKDNGKEELKWLRIQQEEKEAMYRHSQHANSLIIPEEESIWPGNAPAIKLSHELTKAERDSRWRVNEARQLALQKAVNEEVEQGKAELRAELVEREKRKAAEDLQSDAKRRRTLITTMQKTADDAEIKKKEREEAENIRKQNELIKKGRLEKDANVARLLKENNSLTEEEALEDIDRHNNKELERMERQRIELNKHKKATGQAEIPPPSQVNLDAMKTAADKQMEDARKRDKEKKALDGARKVRQAQEQAARARRGAEEKARQAKAATTTSAASQDLQIRWENLIDHFRTQQTGTAGQIEAAQELIAFQNFNDMTKADNATWSAWQRGQTRRQWANQSAALEVAHLSIQLDKDAQQKPVSRPLPTKTTDSPTKTVAPPATKPLTTTTVPPVEESLPLIMVPPVMEPPTPTFISTVTKPPSTVDQALQDAIQDVDIWDADAQKAIFNSMETHIEEAGEALKTRAASANMSILEYLKSIGFHNEKAYIDDQRAKVVQDSKPLPDPDKVKTEEGKNAAHLESYKEDMREAIKEAMKLRMRKWGFDDLNKYAESKGYKNARHWMDAIITKENITLDDIPSRRPQSEMTWEEKSVDQDIWAVWCKRVNTAADWNARINALPRPPKYTPATTLFNDATLRNEMTCDV